jgi:hypothetical protein
VALLRQELSSSSDSSVWSFDAWSHEGDPLRRTFLESLIGHLAKQKWIDGASWDRRIAELARRLKTSDQKTTPRISGYGLALTASALAIPVGSVLLAEAFRAGATLAAGGGLHLQAALGLGLMLLPLPVVAICLAIKWAQFAFAKRRGKSPEAPDYRDIMGIFYSRAVTESRTESIETPEPTSLEFESTFNKLMHEALALSQRRLVLVVDNLDRVQADDALRIWTTLQTFLKPAADRPRWLEQVWIVLPFDRVGLERLWRTRGTEDVSASFIDKSLQVKFEVPVPLVSDWHAYFVELLERALPAHGGDFHTIYRLYAIRGRKAAQPPTPRELLLFVNQLGALHRQWGDSLPLPHLAYYALLVRESLHVPSELLAGNVPSPSELGLLGDGIRDHLAGLAFGVDPGRGRLLLLEQPVLDALSAGSAQSLRSLKEAEPRLQDIVEIAITRAAEDWPAAEGVKLLNAAYALDAAGLLDPSLKERSTAIRLQLLSACGRVEVMANTTPNSERGFVALLEGAVRRDLATSLVRAIASAIALEAETAEAPRLSATVTRLAALIRELSGRGYEVATAKVRLRGPAETYVVAAEAIEAACGPDSMCEALFVPSVPADEFISMLVRHVEAGTFSGSYCAAIRSREHWSSDGDWDSLVALIKAKLTPTGTTDSRQAVALTQALEDLAKTSGSASSALKAIVSEGHVAHFIHLAATTKEYSLAGLMLENWLWFSPQLAAPRAVGNSAQGHALVVRWLTAPPDEVVEALAKVRCNYSDQGQSLWAALDQNPATELLVGATLKSIHALTATGPWLEPSVILKRAAILDHHIGLAGVLDRHDVTKVAELTASAGFDPNQAFLYRALVCTAADNFLDWCVGHLGLLARDVWATSLATQDAILDLALGCQARRQGGGRPLTLGSEFKDALAEYSADLIRGGASVVAGGSVELLVALLNASEREIFVETDLYGQFLKRREGDAPAAFFLLFGDVVAKSEVLLQDPGAIMGVVVPLIKAENAEGLAWVLAQVGSRTAPFSASKESHRRSLGERLRRTIEKSANDGVKTACVGLLAALTGHSSDAKSPGILEATAVDESA